MTKNHVYIIDGARTPFLKAKEKPGYFSASDLAVIAGRELLARQPFAASEISEVILGCVMPSADEANIARVVSLRLGCGKAVPAFTVQRNCASGMQALDSAFEDISSGRAHLVLAGGTEAMSRAPLLFNQSMVNWLSGLWAAKNVKTKVKQVLKFRPYYLAPVVALLKGLSDPLVNMSMGQTAENLAYRFKVLRQQMDQFALESHVRAMKAREEHLLANVVPAYSGMGDCYEFDDGVRSDTTLPKLTSLRPIFDKTFGMVTAGNSSQVTDGAALLLLASEEAVKKYKLPVLARIVATEWAGVDPEEMGLGPVYSTTALLKSQNLRREDIDYWEINEAFAAQVLACLFAWQDADYCKKYLGLDQAFGAIDWQRLNVDGGAIALGHPVGATGARIILQLAYILKRNHAKRGVATLCIGGGQGGSMLIENVSNVGG